MAERTLRVLVLSNSPTPYNDALFAELHRQPGIQLHVVYCTERESHRLWRLSDDKGYAHTVLPVLSIGLATHVNPSVARFVRRFDPNVAVLSGSYTMPTFHLAARALDRRGVPWLYWGEELSFAPAPGARGLLRELLRRSLRRAQGVLAIGSRAARSYARLGLDERRIADFRYYANVERFRLGAVEREAARAGMRAEWGVGADTPTFVFCGQLIRRKGVDTLIDAAAALRDAGVRVRVILTGAGDDEPEFRGRVRALQLHDVVHFAGFVQPDALPAYFAAADALVLPSLQEGWGVVVPEALAAGLPVIASEAVNAAADLVVDDESGYRFPPGDASALAAAMRALADSPERLARMSAAARRAVRTETPAHAGVRLAAMLRRVSQGESLVGAGEDDGVTAQRAGAAATT